MASVGLTAQDEHSGGTQSWVYSWEPPDHHLTSAHWSTEQVPREAPPSRAGSSDEDSGEPDYVNEGVVAPEA